MHHSYLLVIYSLGKSKPFFPRHRLVLFANLKKHTQLETTLVPAQMVNLQHVLRSHTPRYLTVFYDIQIPAYTLTQLSLTAILRAVIIFFSILQMRNLKQVVDLAFNLRCLTLVPIIFKLCYIYT